MPVVVTALAVTPVKGTRLHSVDQLELGPDGARENRRFFVVDRQDRMVNGKLLGELNTVVAEYSGALRYLKLTFLDGEVTEGEVRAGEPITARFHSRVAGGQLVEGPFSEALTRHTGRQLRLVEAADGGAVDRGAHGGASLISRASLRRLAEAANAAEVDSRRFRMLIELDGLGPHVEDRWVGRHVAVGEATVAVRGHVGRCVVTSRHPETGEIDLPTLDIIRSYREEAETTAPIPFGIYGEVVQPGRVRVGDWVTLDG